MVDFIKTANDLKENGRVDTTGIKGFDTKFLLTEFGGNNNYGHKKDNSRIDTSYQEYKKDDNINKNNIKKNNHVKKEIIDLLQPKESQNGSISYSLKSKIAEMPIYKNAGLRGGVYFNSGNHLA